MKYILFTPSAQRVGYQIVQLITIILYIAMSQLYLVAKNALLYGGEHFTVVGFISRYTGTCVHLLPQGSHVCTSTLNTMK